VLEAMALNSSFDPFSLDPMLDFYVRQSGVIIEELDESDLALIEEIIRDKNKINQLQQLEDLPELVEAKVLVPESLEKISEEEESTDDFFEATEADDDALAVSEFSQIEDKTLGESLLTDIVEPIQEEPTIIEEPPLPPVEEPKIDLPQVEETKEVEIKPQTEETQDETVNKSEEIQTPQDEPKEKKEESPDVMMKVEVEFSEDRNLGQATVFRMSLESLPTSSAAASEMQSQLTINMEGLSPSPSSSSLVTSASDQEGTSPKEGRAGRYNKKPAPPRPREVPDEDGPLKARLVLKPGVVRKLPETAVAMSDPETPVVFLNQNAKEKKKSGGRSLLSFWHSKPQQPPSPDQDGNKSTDL
jgi:hypothetical protein